MKSHIVLSIFLVSALFLSAGCFSIDVAANRHTRERHVLVTNYGWYLFGKIPLVCGNVSPRRFTPFAFFRDDVTMDKIQSRFIDFARKEGCEARDMMYHMSDQVLFTLPGSSISFPLPYFITYREIQLSGVLQ